MPAGGGGTGREFRIGSVEADDAQVQALYQRYVEERQCLGEGEAPAYESFRQLIGQQTAKILGDKGARAVDFRLDSSKGKGVAQGADREVTLKRSLFPIILLALLPDPALAWPAETMTALSRDARRLLPRSLSRLLGERETQIRREIDRFPPDIVRALAVEIPGGRLQPETLAALDYETGRVVTLLKEGRVSEGLVRLGGLLRVPADIADPILVGVPEGWPAGVPREYYALLDANLDRMPVVLDDSEALEVTREHLPELWQSMLDRSRPQAPVIRTELFRDGRLVDHRRLDYRSPAWAVASLSYSRAVTGIAATWLAVWREARGDTTSMRTPVEVTPQDREVTAETHVPENRRQHDR